MKCYIADTLFGVFALDEAGTIVNFLDFNNDNQKIIDFYETIDNGNIIQDFEKFIFELKNSGFDEYIFDNKDLESITSQKSGIRTLVEINSLDFKNFRLNLAEQLKNVGITISNNELLAKYKEINEELVKAKVRKAGAQSDIVIIQINETLDIIKKSISLFVSRLREWYGLHFPELTDKVIEDNLVLAKLISILGHRDNFSVDKLKENFDLREERINTLFNLASQSMGADINLKMVKDYADQILSLNKYREELEDNLETLMEKTAPNLRAIVGSLISAKLISKAGSLKKLAFMPASRVQLLGAEKALYRFLRTGEKKPKHGLIFQWSQIRGSRPWIRGKISRLIAGKIGLASKVDYFSGDFIGDEFSIEIEEKIKDIVKRYPNPPPKKEIKKTTKTRKGQKRRR
jgi:nucleolar protein 56